jgi:hypothetical protein
MFNSRYFYLLILIAFVFQSCKPIQPQKEHEFEFVDSKDYMLVDVPYTHDHISGGQLKGNQLSSLKEYLISSYNINLNEINFLTVGYLKSRDDCWYNNYGFVNTNASKKFREECILQSNTELLFLHHDKGHGGGISKYDMEHFFHDLFPVAHGDSFCDYTITISKTGNYLFQVGHFDIKVANAFKNELEAHEISKLQQN